MNEGRAVAMNAEQRREARRLEGRMVHVALDNGVRVDDSALISFGRHSVWLFVNGDDAFFPVDSVVAIWESQPYRSAA